MIVDANVLIDVFSSDPDWLDWSIHQMAYQSQKHRLIINPIIYAELSPNFSTMEKLDEKLAEMKIPLIEIPRLALFLASKKFIDYRKNNKVKHAVLSDFLIGSHASINKIPLLTRDTSHYQRYFPDVKLISPQNHPEIPYANIL